VNPTASSATQISSSRARSEIRLTGAACAARTRRRARCG
jgi:hypothetical protein